MEYRLRVYSTRVAEQEPASDQWDSLRAVINCFKVVRSRAGDLQSVSPDWNAEPVVAGHHAPCAFRRLMPRCVSGYALGRPPGASGLATARIRRWLRLVAANAGNRQAELVARAGPLAIGFTSLARAFRPDFPAALRLTAIRSPAAAPRIRLNRASVPGRSELTSAIGNALSNGLHQALANRFVGDLRCVEPIALVSSEPTANGAHGGESAFLGLMGWIRVARPGASCRLDQ